MKFDPSCIQFRLTAGMVLASILGFGGMTAWSNFRMQHILIKGHKDNAVEIAERFGQDVAWMDKTMPSTKALEKVINYRSTADTVIWIRSPDGTLIAQSDTLEMGSWKQDGLAEELLELSPGHKLESIQIQDRTLIVCISPLDVNGNLLGDLFVIDDITQNQASFAAVTRDLTIGSIFVIGLSALVIAIYVRQSIKPVCKMNELAANVTPENLADTHLEFDRAPTEVRDLAKAFNMMLGRLSGAWEQQRRFVSDVSHELRTPLTLVHGYLQSTLRRCNTLTEPQREGLEIAASEADRTIRLLQDLLDLARADGGHMRFHIERVPLKEIILEIIEMSSYSSDRVKADIQMPGFEARADCNRLKQVLINLIDNAVKYSDADTVVTVRLKQEGEWAVIQICDRGRGIPTTDLTQIFEPFYRVDEDRCRTTGGTGLGLSIVKTLVEGMRGKIKVQSKPGEGSIFTVSLPT
ncbi:sensor histidine kinase [Leptothoe sp. PORK10 BA2]|uniref:sensor histidine kinase n=1 Tax=Leptothoe sp. PORK10 BA2 TaxID=3110254 RepID=UPI002B1EBE46|nr:HAMP domain-containing sensor histidine kinase [Leptothoe sp. PORK10 BA2]MEA5464203.1 HAMP domain-containing sensor histidine kinase [Leptothoe sp. PORK10 BA2]